MRLIVTADDFGRSHQINQAIARAHREGILTSASLMVAGDAVDEAVTIAKEHPKLGVGLHLVLIDGPAVLSREKIPGLVNDRGFFPNSPARLGIRYTLSRRIRAHLEAEIEAQFEKFASFRIPLSHVDGHQHMHLLPAVFPIVVRLARKHGAKGIRIVRGEGFWANRSVRFSAREEHPRALKRTLQQLVWAASFKWMSRNALRQVREGNRGPGFQPMRETRKSEQPAIFASPTRVENPCHDKQALIIADRVYGLMGTGRMNAAYVRALLHSLTQRQTDELLEIYFHPTLGPRLGEFGPNPDDFNTLIDPQIEQMIGANGIELTTYRDAGNMIPPMVPARRESPGCSA